MVPGESSLILVYFLTAVLSINHQFVNKKTHNEHPAFFFKTLNTWLTSMLAVPFSLRGDFTRKPKIKKLMIGIYHFDLYHICKILSLNLQDEDTSERDEVRD